MKTRCIFDIFVAAVVSLHLWPLEVTYMGAVDDLSRKHAIFPVFAQRGREFILMKLIFLVLDEAKRHEKALWTTLALDAADKDDIDQTIKVDIHVDVSYG